MNLNSSSHVRKERLVISSDRLRLGYMSVLDVDTNPNILAPQSDDKDSLASSPLFDNHATSSPAFPLLIISSPFPKNKYKKSYAASSALSTPSSGKCDGAALQVEAVTAGAGRYAELVPEPANPRTPAQLFNVLTEGTWHVFRRRGCP